MDEEDFDYLPLTNANTLSVPNEPALLAVYELYRSPLTANQHLLSERNRETFAELLNGPDQVPTLADLCVRQLAKRGNAHVPAAVREDPLKMRIFYDSLDVELPLRECYSVEDVSYWRRVVLAKCSETCLVLKGLNDYDWRPKGLSLKYVELVEACPAALWPEQEMSELAELIYEHVRSIDIRHLQSLTEYSFRKAGREEDDSEPEISSEESEGIEISSDEPMTPEDGDEEGEEEESTSSRSEPNKAIGFKTNFSLNFSDEEEGSDNERRKRRQERNAARQRLRDLKAAKEAERAERKLRISEMRKRKIPEKTKKKKRKQRIQGAFDIQVEPEPEDGEIKKMDRRNKLKYLKHLQNMNYPEDDCHHIDLSFVRHFVNLVSLNLEFLGPALGREYHKRHSFFSVKDINRLARGLASLQQLQIFRLRNSRLSSIKLYTLVRALRLLPLLEVVDFGYNQMTDDCGPELGSLLDRPHMLKSLELEYNRLDTRAMTAIGAALQKPSLAKLDYLGLAHNKMSGDALSILCNRLIGTEHVQELNISGIDANPRTVADDISVLLRGHDPLRRLIMAAIPLGPKLGITLICALNANTNISYFDCRDCDLNEEEELEADLIVRRNVFVEETSFVCDTERFPSVLDVFEFAKTMRHPITQKILDDMAKRKECLLNYPPPTPSVQSFVQQSLVTEESEYDIWKVLGITPKADKEIIPTEELPKQMSSTSVNNKEPFIYEPNDFDLEQFREHVFLPGTPSRYSYFLKQRDSK
ncbi:uncharacterized protein LOC108113811 [Drosophila eugracilis]|uniref:uncharacterized protein LOC108113811 n=1 Tax=Drosophila eugracilis TaxID=29029 RepID=UPI001BDA94BC|nr:uncharacterized protein LOC108113811 [Drosophila eugracilis]